MSNVQCGSSTHSAELRWYVSPLEQMKNNWFNSHELLWNMVQFHRAGNVASLFICLCCVYHCTVEGSETPRFTQKKSLSMFLPKKKFILATLKIQYFYRMILINYRKGIHPDHLGSAWKSPRIMFCHSLLYSFSVREQNCMHFTGFSSRPKSSLRT